MFRTSTLLVASLISLPLMMTSEAGAAPAPQRCGSQSRFPTPPRASSGFESIRQRIAAQTPGQGRGRDRLCDRRYRDTDNTSSNTRTVKASTRSSKSSSSRPSASSSSHVRPERHAPFAYGIKLLRKDLLLKQKKAELSWRNLQKEGPTPRAELCLFRIQYYRTAIDLLDRYETAIEEGVATPAELRLAAAGSTTPAAAGRFEKGSFEERRDKFLIYQASRYGDAHDLSTSPEFGRLVDGLGRFTASLRAGPE